MTVQGFIETIFSILEDEDLAAGGKVARDLLQCLINVVGQLALEIKEFEEFKVSLSLEPD